MAVHEVVRDGAEMVRRMDPARLPGRLKALFIESEGPSVLLPATEDDADAMAQITLRVHSALDGVGLTAAVSGALAGAGIPCNVIAATRHDHIFVPEARAAEALECLSALASSTGKDRS